MSKHHRAVIRWKNQLRRRGFSAMIEQIWTSCTREHSRHARCFVPLWRKPGDLFTIACVSKLRANVIGKGMQIDPAQVIEIK